MGFEVRQGDSATAAPTHAVTLESRQKTVYLTLQDGSYTARLERGSSTTSVQAAWAKVYINEHGREIAVSYTQTSGTAVAVPRTSPGTAATPTGHWRVTPDRDNVREEMLEDDLRARISRPEQIGSECRFRTSRCGKDVFIVSYAPTPGVAPASRQFLVIEVRKRIHYHYRRMARSAGAADHFDLTDVYGDDDLGYSTSYFANNFGIELVEMDAADVGFEPDLIGAGNLRNHVGVPATAPPRELWILAGGYIRDTAGGDRLAGLAANSVAAVSLRLLEDELSRYQQIVAAWQRYRTRPEATPQDFANTQFSPPPTPDQRRLILALTRANTTPESMISNQIYATLIHEIGHTLGLVPSSASAAGLRCGGWMDQQAGHGHHCNSNSCAMWWEVDLSGFLPAWESASQDPVFQGGKTTACGLFMHACDLRDVPSAFAGP